MRPVLLVLFVLVMALIPDPPGVPGCAVIPHTGEYVNINAEEALIVFDAATRTEHFIRRADFRTEARDFGFLVPTPARPELGEIDTRIFFTLQQATAPRHVDSGKVRRITIRRNHGAGAAAAAPPAPQILEQKKVAGYDATVLRADDTEGLKKWLEDHHYDARPVVMDWLKWYVANKWIITAFKVDRDADTSDRWARSVRMTFATDTPFYPYREPEDKPPPDPHRNVPPSRQLRVFLLADTRYQGTLGVDGAWAGRTVWSNKCPGVVLSEVLPQSGLPMPTLEGKTWHLTEFEDNSSPRPAGNEVYFHRSENQAPVERPVIYDDRYEYVYVDEDRSSAAGNERSVDPGEAFSREVLQMGIVLVVVLATIVLLVVVLRKRRTT